MRRSGGFLIGIAVLALLAGAALSSAPAAAPRVMTMGTMSWMKGVTGYQDEGHCEFEMIDMDNPTQRIERSFACGFAWDWSDYEDGEATVHEALFDHETGGVFEVPDMERGRMQEWYRVNGHMLTPDALQFRGPVRGQAGVLMPPPESGGQPLNMGWVESGGRPGAAEHLVAPRPLEPVGETPLYDIEWTDWSSSIDQVRTRWHGYDLYLTEDVFLRSDPKTAWILEMERHVVVEMTPHQMANVFGLGLEETDLPVDWGSMGEPEWVMELHYKTNEDKRSDHADQAKEFRQMLAMIDDAGDWGPWILLGSLGGLIGGVVLVAVGRREVPARPPAHEQTGARAASPTSKKGTAPVRPKGIDPRSPRFSQGVTATLLLAAFLLAGVWSPVVFAVPGLAVVLGAGALFGPRFNLWGLLFVKVVVPVIGLGPPGRRKDPAPTRFALLLGAVFLSGASVLLLGVTGGVAHWIGWALALAVAALALLAAVTDICVGCEIYNFLLRQKGGRVAQRP